MNNTNTIITEQTNKQTAKSKSKSHFFDWPETALESSLIPGGKRESFRMLASQLLVWLTG